MARLIRLSCLFHQFHQPVLPPRPWAWPVPTSGPRTGPPARPRAPGTVGTVRFAALAALSMALLAGCGGGEAGSDAHAESAESATAAAGPFGPSDSGAKGEASGAAGSGLATDARLAAIDFRLESEYGPGDAPSATKREVADAPAERGHRAAVPVDRQAHTRAGRYLSRAVAERLYEETAGRAVWVDAGCCAGHDPELPERIAFGMQAVLGGEAPLFISGSDLRQAARLADRLDALGVGRVYLVTP